MMEELKAHLLKCKKVTVREYISQATGEVRMYITFHYLKGVKELSYGNSDEVTKLIDDYLMGKQI